MTFFNLDIIILSFLNTRVLIESFSDEVNTVGCSLVEPEHTAHNVCQKLKANVGRKEKRERDKNKLYARKSAYYLKSWQSSAAGHPEVSTAYLLYLPSWMDRSHDNERERDQ